MTSSPVLAELTVSAPRRIFAYLVLLGLGAIVLWLVFRHPPSAVWAAAMIAVGVAALLLAEALRRATRTRLILTSDGLADATGTLLVALADIDSVSRGTFSFKPSNGFVLVLKTSGRLAWAPGVWWRIGNRFGVGGVVSAGAAKFMAERIAAEVGR